MAAAERKNRLVWLIAVAAVYLIILILLIGGGDNGLAVAFKRAPTVANLLGILMIFGSYFAFYLGGVAVGNAGKYWAATGILLVFGILVAGGFNFNPRVFKGENGYREPEGRMEFLHQTEKQLAGYEATP